MFFDNCILDTRLVPYYFLLNVYKFHFKMNADFDLGIVQCYYPDQISVCMVGFLKIELYQKYLFSLNSKVFFKENIFYDLNNDIDFPLNWLVYQYYYNNDLVAFLTSKKSEYFNKKLNSFLIVNVYKK